MSGVSPAADVTVAAHARQGLGQPAAGGRFIAGDPLRAIAALTVVVFHVAFLTLWLRGVGVSVPELVFPTAYGSDAWRGFAYLNLGLFIFFVLSGYLIARPFIRAFVAGEATPSIPRYARNRLLRIVPAFWILFTILLLRHGAGGSSPGEIASVYLFAQDYNDSSAAFYVGPAWTLSVEMGFYALVPLLTVAGSRVVGRRLGTRARLKLVVAFAIAVASGSLLFRGLRPNDGPFLSSLPSNLFAFVPGVLLATLEIELAPRLRGRRVGRIAALALLPVGFLLLALYTRLPLTSERSRGLLEAAGCGALVAAPLVLQWTTGGAWRLLDNPVLRWLGVRSYSIYLIHVGVLLELGSLARSSSSPKAAFPLLLLAGVPLVIVASAVSYRFFELPFLRRRARWRRPAARGATE